MGQPRSQTAGGSQPPRPHTMQVLEEDHMPQPSWDVVKDGHFICHSPYWHFELIHWCEIMFEETANGSTVSAFLPSEEDIWWTIIYLVDN